MLPPTAIEGHTLTEPSQHNRAASAGEDRGEESNYCEQSYRHSLAMKLILLLMLSTANVISSKHSERRLTCDCQLHKIHFRQIDISCGYNMTNVQQSGEAPKVHCSNEITGYVPHGYDYMEGVGFFKLFRTSLLYEGALARCQQDGALLAVPNSAAEAQAMAGIMRKNVAVKEAYVGINDLKKTGTFKSIQGTPVSSLGYNQWSPGQPDNSGPVGEQCVTINSEGLYNDNRCDWVFAFFCKRTLPFVLPSGYKYLPQMGFYKHYTTPNTYEAARQRCVADGGHLAVLDTQKEADEIIQFYDANKDVTESYVGLNDIQQEGVFVSETGKPLMSLPFCNFYPGEPNNGAGKGEHCITFHVAGTYNDVACGRMLPYFCEIPPPAY